MKVEIYVPCTPVAEPRKRTHAFQLAGRILTQAYTPTTHPVNAFKAAIGYAWLNAGGKLAMGPLRLDVEFVLPRPKRLKVGERVDHDKKPDMDNLLKSTKDGLTACGAWHDDAQVCRCHAVKSYADSREDPHVEICITTLED